MDGQMKEQTNLVRHIMYMQTLPQALRFPYFLGTRLISSPTY